MYKYLIDLLQERESNIHMMPPKNRSRRQDAKFTQEYFYQNEGFLRQAYDGNYVGICINNSGFPVILAREDGGMEVSKAIKDIFGVKSWTTSYIHPEKLLY